jgi:hypothetical protein
LNRQELKILEEQTKQEKNAYKDMTEKYQHFYALQEKWFNDKSSVTGDEIISAQDEANEAKEKWQKSWVLIPKQ